MVGMAAQAQHEPRQPVWVAKVDKTSAGEFNWPGANEGEICYQGLQFKNYEGSEVDSCYFGLKQCV